MARPARPRPPLDEAIGPGTREAVGGALSIDRVVHARMRLAMIAALALNDSLGFAELKELLGATDGNLIVHARRLEDSGYISCTKVTEWGAPRTIYRLAPAGRAALRRYLDRIEQLAAALRERHALHTRPAGESPE